MIAWEMDAKGVVSLTWDDPDARVNTMNEAFVSALGEVVDRLEAEREQVAGVVLLSGKSSFSAGADLAMLRDAGPDSAAYLMEFIERLKALFRRLETLGRPVVAALGGSALGGGFELALAAHHRIVVDAPRTRVGLPEVTLGLLPGAGGVTRVTRMLGLQRALSEVLLPGTRFRVAEALELGLIDELVDSPKRLMAAARAWIAANPQPAKPWDVKGFVIPGGGPAELASVLPVLPAMLRKQLKGAPMPAPRSILAAAVEGAHVDIDTALLVESRYFVELAVGQVARNMVGAFFDQQAIAAGASRPEGFEKSTAARVGVIGAGMMGAGIAYVAAKSGAEVVLRDVTREAAERGRAHAEGLEARALERGRTTPELSAGLLGRIRPTASLDDLAGVDVVVEAVFESVELKQQVFAEVEPIVGADALLGSNTSTLPITALAGAVGRPNDFVGIHFFSPVDKMPLVELIRGEQTSDAALARAFDFAVQLGKTPIVVNDSRGFFTSRVISRFLAEALAAVGEGVEPASVEQAALQAGFPAGPLQLIDELTLTLTRTIREESRAAALESGRPWMPHRSEVVADLMIDDFGRAGRASGAGFYDYADGKRTGLWPGLREAFNSGSADVAFADLQERFLFAQAVEAVRCLEEGVLLSVADANVGSMLGIGFPPWTGGVLQFVNQYEGGLPGFVARTRELEALYGPHFEPPALLLQKADAGERFA